MRLEGKTAIVTGGSDGIGLAIAEAFAKEGAAVVLVGRDGDKLAAAGERLGGALRGTIATELTQELGIEAVVEGARLLERVDVLVNNAGVAFLTPFEEVTLDRYHYSFALNVTAVYFLTQKLLPMLKPGASVINISSYFAHKMIRNRPSSLYSLSKGAVDALTRSLAYELGPRGIRVNAIAPGTVDTAMRRKSIERLPPEAQAELQAYVERSYPLGRIGRPSDIGGIAVYLASDEAEWTSGAVFAVDGGYTAG
jgi:NAD(P)-dependent dehydrogenase (short-subunit alcohol dehydrogenase family)